MKKVKTYRCSCCNEEKKETNQVYRLWTQLVAPYKSPIVVICRKCNLKIKKASPIYGVSEFLDWKRL